MLRWLLAAHGFEQFLSRKFPASKRFGLEGCEALLPGLLALVEAGANSGLRKVIMRRVVCWLLRCCWCCVLAGHVVCPSYMPRVMCLPHVSVCACVCRYTRPCVPG